MMQELSAHKRARAMEQQQSADDLYVATAGAENIRGVGSSVLIPGSAYVNVWPTMTFSCHYFKSEH
jgi:hypothetical protein